MTDGQRMERDMICSYLFHIGVAPYKLPDRIIYVERLPYIDEYNRCGGFVFCVDYFPDERGIR
ncbi:hypothetical protein, partial [Lysinibacillus fusiformis]|uniref:hypothetical protein n=1 Tax=Lysinibacillus fusiformis TaxID=28031 RepID=UPI0020C176BA